MWIIWCSHALASLCVHAKMHHSAFMHIWTILLIYKNAPFCLHAYMHHSVFMHIWTILRIYKNKPFCVHAIIHHSAYMHICDNPRISRPELEGAELKWRGGRAEWCTCGDLFVSWKTMLPQFWPVLGDARLAMQRQQEQAFMCKSSWRSGSC